MKRLFLKAEVAISHNLGGNIASEGALYPLLDVVIIDSRHFFDFDSSF